MAITITAPQSGYFDRTGAITVSWTNSITSPPQTAYEIMYKLKTASSWSTLGRVTSTATSANLKPIYDAVSQDAQEFYYKVVVYHDLATLSSGNKEGGVEHSAVYSLMFHGSQIGTLKIQESSSVTREYPLFNGSTAAQKLNVRTTASATGTAPLVASGHPLAGRGKVITASGYTAFIGGSSPTFAASGQTRYGYFYGYKYVYTPVYYNYNYANYRTDSYKQLQYYYRVYNVDVTSSHYKFLSYYVGTLTYYRYYTTLGGTKYDFLGYLWKYLAMQGTFSVQGGYIQRAYIFYTWYISSYYTYRYISSYSYHYTSYNNQYRSYARYNNYYYQYTTQSSSNLYRPYYGYYYSYYYTRVSYGYKPLIGAYTYRYYNRLWGPVAYPYLKGYYRYYGYYTYNHTVMYVYAVYYGYRVPVLDTNYSSRTDPRYQLGSYSFGGIFKDDVNYGGYYRAYSRYNKLDYYYTYYSYTYINSYTNTNRYWYTRDDSYNYQYYTR